MTGLAVDLVCAAVGHDPERFSGVVVGPAAARDAPDGIAVWPCVTWTPAAGWDPAVPELSTLDPDWTGLVRYAPESSDALAEWIVAPVAAAVATAGRPLLVGWTGHAALPVDRIHALARAHPGLTIVVAADADQSPTLLACLAAAVPGLLVATCGLATGTLAALAGSVGLDRLVFGSGHPLRSPSTELRRVTSLGPPEQLRAVLAGNARRLLRGASR